MTSFSIDTLVLKTIHTMATAPTLNLSDISFRFVDKKMMCRLRTQQGFVAFSYISHKETDIDTTELYKVTFDAGDIGSILKMTKDEAKIGFNIKDGKATVVANNAKKKIPLIETHIWMDRFPSPEISQLFILNTEQIRGLITSFDVKDDFDGAKVLFNPDGITFINISEQRQTEVSFKKEDLGRTHLTKMGQARFASKSLMGIFNTIPKGVSADIAVDVNMPFSITFDVDAGRFKVLLAPYIDDD